MRTVLDFLSNIIRYACKSNCSTLLCSCKMHGLSCSSTCEDYYTSSFDNNNTYNRIFNDSDED